MDKGRIRIQITFSKRQLKIALVSAIVAGGLYALESQETPETGAHPSPSGVYSKLISTAAALLAQDGDKVGVGQSNPAETLDVQAGDIRVSSQVISGTGLCIVQNGARVCKSGWYTSGAGILLQGQDETLIAVNTALAQKRGALMDCGVGNAITGIDQVTGNVQCASLAIPICGDAACNGTETCSSCPRDCGTCAARCPDNACNGNETCFSRRPGADNSKSCLRDCGICEEVCGDGYCFSGEETCGNCDKDCGECAPCCYLYDPRCFGGVCRGGSVCLREGQVCYYNAGGMFGSNTIYYYCRKAPNGLQASNQLNPAVPFPWNLQPSAFHCYINNPNQ